MKIDAEVHFWKSGKSGNAMLNGKNKILNQDYLPEHINQSLIRNGIDGCIAVASDDKEVETRFLGELSLTHAGIFGVIGWIDFQNIQSARLISELHAFPALKGFRLEVKENHAPAQEIMDILHENGYSLDISPDNTNNLSVLSKLVQAFPEQQFVLRNCGNPDSNGLPSKGWEKSIRELSEYPNLCCKVAGLLTGGIDPKAWKPADIFPFLDILFSSFGAERLMFASDWPYLLQTGIYVQWKSLLEKFTEKFSQEDRDNFFGENAKRIYQL